ncbi:mannitol dehydrogenase family protein [Mycetocola tolaasinivorans]|uniref:Mannitol dehydrogenase family protein n=1 Tax=Mycetocola tolaasinivorans TaxID=76635 RepID=A0A3L7ACP5_9MICO|nr:mannitol dehydrogenase family protein [Mycetocola tolaasinivorans]RLP77997.1 mannitol dehydrogenase family protein [Mycetocola tolaasinivorans]
MSVDTAPRLTREPGTAAPVRIVHLGIGAFARAHQAWLTALADTAGEWGIAAFTGRSTTVADELAPQGGLYTLITRGADGDRAEIVDSIVAVYPGSDIEAWTALVSAPTTALLTLTITEAGYRLGADGALDTTDPAVRADLEGFGTDRAPETAPGRLVHGLAARRASGAGPMAIVSCDNLPGNGELVRAMLADFAAAVDPGLADWIAENVSSVSTSIDRITPRTTAEDIETVAKLTGFRDASPVVTEPFFDWVLSGDFPAGRPAWEAAGARFVTDIEPFEARKLWLLNGAHTLLASAGRLRGHETVAEALADPVCREWVEAFWDEAARHLTAPELELPRYRAQLIERFENPRIRHNLAQIALDNVTKIRLRILPVLRAERAAGRTGEAAARAIAAWATLEAAAQPGREITEILADLDPQLVDEAVLRARITGLIAELLAR